MKYIKLIILLTIFSIVTYAQDSTKIAKPTHKIFASIYTAGYYNFNTVKPNAGFDVSTALIGYSFKKADILKFTLIYDVTRTTNGIIVQDTAGNQLPVHYFEGSKYTAFLKMAELKWNFAKNFSLATGQLLNQQYLTVQDKFWAHRYVLVTMQELYRMAAPADFGMRVEYKNTKTFAFSLGAVNGNGPFRKQDTLSTIQYNTNFELYLIKNFLIKTYIAITPATFETNNNLSTAFSGFIAYKQKKYKIGVEYSYTNNVAFTSTIFSGVSAFAMYNVAPKWEVFGRYDYVDNSGIAKLNNTYVAGFQYEPQKRLYLSVNYRYWSSSEISQIYLNVGAKF